MAHDLFVYIHQKSAVYIPINIEFLGAELNAVMHSAEDHHGVFCNKSLGIYIEGANYPTKTEFIQACIKQCSLNKVHILRKQAVVARARNKIQDGIVLLKEAGYYASEMNALMERINYIEDVLLRQLNDSE